MRKRPVAGEIAVPFHVEQGDENLVADESTLWCMRPR